MRRFLVLAALPLLLNACATLLISGATETAVTAAENRSAGRKVDDKLLYADVLKQFAEADKVDLVRDININTRFGRVMLTGTVDTERAADTAVTLAGKAKGVEEVINELIVDPKANLLTTANDSLIKRNLEARLFMTKDVWVINYSIDVQNNVAYLIGRVRDQAELDRVLNIARTTKGVKRVVSHLDINADDGSAVKNTPTSGSKNGTVEAPEPIESAPLAPTNGGY